MTATLLPPISLHFSKFLAVSGAVTFVGNKWNGFLPLFFSDLSDLLISNCFMFYFPLPFSLSLYFQVFFASLLPPSLHPPSSLPSCRVMYGPRQHWDQWDASCFNLAPEPSRSKSRVSPKSDGAALSLPPCTSHPHPLPDAALCCIDQHLAPVGK